jgi:iron complex transport system substrate-binding protein
MTRPRLRIAALQPSISITLAHLGALDDLVACTKWCLDAVPELGPRGVQILADSWSSNTEQILAAQPSLVLASVPYRMESLAAILKAGCPVLALTPRTLSDIYADIRLLGSIVHRAEAAEACVAGMETAIEATRTRAAAAEQKPLVYAEEWGKPLIHSQTWVAELIDAAGGRFLGTPGSTTEAEQVAAADPDAMVFAWCGAGDRVPLERVAARRGWGGLRAVAGRRVFCVPDELLNTPAPTLIQGLRALASALHPEIFGKSPDVRQIGPVSPGVLPI